MPVSAGTAFVDVKGDFASLNKQIAGQQGILGGKFGKIGKVAGGALVGGLAAAGIGKALYNVGKSFDEAYDTIRVGTGATGKSLERLKGDFKNVVKGVPASFSDAGTAIAEVNTRLDLTGKPLRDRSKQFLELSRITGTDLKTNIEAVSKSFQDWEIPVKNQGRVLDGFFRLSQKTGIGVADLARNVQEFGSPLRQLGFTLEEAAATFAGFEKAGVNTSTMVPGLKLAISGLTRPTKGLSETMKRLGIATGDPEKALKQVMRIMSDDAIPTAERTGLAMDVFGKRAGADMAEAIKQGRFEVGDLMDVMKNGSDTIMKAGKDTQSFSEKWQLFKNRVLVALEPVAMRVFDGMGKMMDVLPGIVGRITDAVRTLLGPFVAVGKAVLGSKEAMVALSPIAAMLAVHFARLAVAAAFSAAVRGLVTAFWALSAAQHALNAAMRANPIGMVITAISLLVAGLIVAYQKSETFRAVVQGALAGVTAAFEWLKTAVADAVAWLVGAWGTLKNAASAVFGAIGSVISGAWNLISTATSAVWGVIGPYLTALWNGLVAVATPVFKVIAAIVKATWTVIAAVTNAIWEVIKKTLEVVWALLKIGFTFWFNVYKTIVTTAWNVIKSVTQAVWNFLKGALEKVWKAIKAIATTLWSGIRKVIIDPVRSAVNWVVARFETAKKWLGERWNAIKGAARTAWNAIKGVVEKPIKDAVSFIVERFGKARGWLKEKWDAIIRSAQVFGKIFENRMARAFGGVANKVINFVNKIIDAINWLFGKIGVEKLGRIERVGVPEHLSVREATKQVAGRARGGLVDRPTVLVGEEGAAHPEFVIPTNPAYRDRAMALMASAAEKMDMEGFARGGVLGNADTFASVAKSLGAGAKSTLALFMAGVVESGMRNLSGGHLDSRGILQVRDATARAMGINNMSVAQVAAAFLRRGFWGKGGAMALARGPQSPGWVAQQVQGSAFPGRYDQERGRALGFLKAARGKAGGLGDLLKGVLKGALTGFGSAMIDPQEVIRKLPGLGKLPGWLKGVGRKILDSVTGFIKDKVASLVGGGGSATGLSDQVKLAVSFAKKHGWGGQVVSGFRSRAKQQALYNAYRAGRGNLAAPPGSSMHEKGLAVDVSDPEGFARAMTRMVAGRLYRKVPGEPWHFSTTGFAKGGVLSKAMAMPQFGGSFANGGIVPGAVGQPRTVIAHGGEQIGPPGMNPEDWQVSIYIGGERIDERVDVRFERKERAKDAAWRAGIQT